MVTLLLFLSAVGFIAGAGYLAVRTKRRRFEEAFESEEDDDDESV